MVNFLKSAVGYISSAVVENTRKGLSQDTRNRFKQLSFGQKTSTVVLTILASPLLIVGGIATFGKMVDFYSKRNITQISPDNKDQTQNKIDRASGEIFNLGLPSSTAESRVNTEGFFDRLIFDEEECKDLLYLFINEKKVRNENLQNILVSHFKELGQISLSIAKLNLAEKNDSAYEGKIPKIKEILQDKLGLTLVGEPRIEEKNIIFDIKKEQ